MSYLSNILRQSARGLGVQSAASATASHNLQNAATPGYTRQRAELVSSMSAQFSGKGWMGTGVDLQSISQTRDIYLESMIPAAISSRAESGALYETLRTVAVFDPIGETGISGSIAEFYAALRELSQNPGSSSLRQSFIATAGETLRTFHLTAKSIEDARRSVDTRLRTVIDEVNQLADEIACLKREINIASSTGHAPNDLIDARTRACERLVELTGGSIMTDNRGHVFVNLPSGSSLVAGPGKVHELKYSPDPSNSGHLAVEIQGAGSGSTRLKASSFGGVLGGILTARDESLEQMQSGLDSLVFDFAETLNGVHSTGYAMDGTTGRDLFIIGADEEGAASGISLNSELLVNPENIQLSGSSGASGDAEIGLLMLATEFRDPGAGMSPAEKAAMLSSSLGTMLRRAENAHEQDRIIENNLMDRRAEVSGVSIDEELIELTKAQHAYSAILRVIQTADEMLESLMRL